MSLTNPLEARLLLGNELRRLRRAAGLTMHQVAEHLDCSDSRISRLENGKLTGAVLKPVELRRLAVLFGVTDVTAVDDLLRLLGESETTAWWAPYEDVMPSGLDSVLGMQTAAHRERAPETLLIHSLLQTADYTRALLEGSGFHSPAAVERLVALRGRRPEVLHKPGNPLNLEVVLDEAALRRPVGSPKIMREQLRAIIATVQALSNVTVLVLPFASGAHAGLSGAFSLFDIGDQPTVAYVDSPAGNLLLHGEREVRQLADAYQRIRRRALGQEESLRFIDQVAKET
ncbi:helix-turn-helix domain-containing protein [Kitasatospora sp. NPDC057198]|uniref:helix-turn-helix domain-containing protein n=1 Tax=Kitasatospora sp. NPDC057198 TaxID=3346046 RepID=UPI0036342E7F